MVSYKGPWAYILHNQADDLVGQIEDVADWTPSTIVGLTGMFAGRHVM